MKLEIDAWKINRKEQMTKTRSLRYSLGSLKIRYFLFLVAFLKKIAITQETAITWLHQDFNKAFIFLTHDNVQKGRGKVMLVDCSVR